jgi:hypothetical protein
MIKTDGIIQVAAVFEKSNKHAYALHMGASS